MNKTAFIIGVNGQDGSYLAEYLLELGYKVVGLVRRTSMVNRSRIDHISNDRFFLEWGDICDAVSISSILTHYKPDEVYNLAAQSHVGVSFSAPISTQDINGSAVVQLMSLLSKLAPDAKVYNAATSELFGGFPGQAPQCEKTPFYPKSPYGVSKLTAYWATVNARESQGLFAVNGLLFNHESERRGHNFVTKKAAVAIAEIALGCRKKVSFGNLNAIRDWGYAPEYVRAMHLIVNADSPTDYVIGTGVPMTVRDFIKSCFEEAELNVEWIGEGADEKAIDPKSGRVILDVDPMYFRPAEVEVLIANPDRASRELGWTASTHSHALAQKMVRFEINRLTSKL